MWMQAITALVTITGFMPNNTPYTIQITQAKKFTTRKNSILCERKESIVTAVAIHPIISFIPISLFDLIKIQFWK